MAGTVEHRVYTVREGLLDEWVRRWREEIVPLRLELGFTIEGAWIDRENNRFIWTLGYDGPEGFAEANRRYWASPRRAAMNLDPEDYLLSTEKTTVTRVY
ncbi:NIPSNAP family protein [Thermobifida cellulosilytica]|uniref:NIPSNAP family containing protein n=1 Tax=Thermobifida cellulosilytica TB100 TaxID=665004 RepID=A0A147KKZ9_THECS|nr:NIPSNAP family protein [Thermobifida cellulosilytica]KUP97966.1 NIPSNAP family containing protein [Thermobifida cellulosilytica TB100]